MSRRGGPENFEDFEKDGWVECSIWVFGIWSDEIVLGLDRQRWDEILDATRCAVRWVCQHSLVSIGFYELCLSPRVTKDRSQKEINPFVSETTVLPVLLLLTAWVYNTMLVMANHRVRRETHKHAIHFSIRNFVHLFCQFSLWIVSPVGWGSRIYWLHLCRRVRYTNECPEYDTKPYDYEATARKLWECGVPFHFQYSQVHSDSEW